MPIQAIPDAAYGLSGRNGGERPHDRPQAKYDGSGAEACQGAGLPLTATPALQRLSGARKPRYHPPKVLLVNFRAAVSGRHAPARACISPHMATFDPPWYLSTTRMSDGRFSCLI